MLGVLPVSLASTCKNLVVSQDVVSDVAAFALRFDLRWVLLAPDASVARRTETVCVVRILRGVARLAPLSFLPRCHGLPRFVTRYKKRR